jgi:hypothetical protein
LLVVGPTGNTPEPSPVAVPFWAALYAALFFTARDRGASL